MKAPSAGFRIVHRNTIPLAEAAALGLTASGGRLWGVVETATGRLVWQGKTLQGARNAHYRLAVAKITGKPVSAAQARRAGNA